VFDSAPLPFSAYFLSYNVTEMWYHGEIRAPFVWSRMW